MANTTTARRRQEAPQQLIVSVITESDVVYGLARISGLPPPVREAMRMRLNTISAPPFERKDARVAAQLRASRNGRGAPIGAYDPPLAACALRWGSSLSAITHSSSRASAGSVSKFAAGRKRHFCHELPDQSLARDCYHGGMYLDETQAQKGAVRGYPQNRTEASVHPRADQSVAHGLATRPAPPVQTRADLSAAGYTI